MEEKRRFIRFKLSLRGKFELEGGMELSPRVQIADFSREGLKVVFPQKVFLKANLVKLEFHLPNRSAPIVMEGRTKWMRSIGTDWEMGMKLEKMDPADKSEVLDYAYKLWRDKKVE